MSYHRERAHELLQRMNLTEKAAQLCAVWLVIEEDGSFSFRDVQKDFIPASFGDPVAALGNGMGAITRPYGTRPIDARSCVQDLNSLQRFLVEKTRLGIPALPHEECLPGLCAKGATLFPSALNFGSMWDEELMHEVAHVIGNELWSVGSKQGLAPVVDVSRDDRWGRTEETSGEDPYLTGCMVVAYVPTDLLSYSIDIPTRVLEPGGFRANDRSFVGGHCVSRSGKCLRRGENATKAMAHGEPSESREGLEAQSSRLRHLRSIHTEVERRTA